MISMRESSAIDGALLIRARATRQDMVERMAQDLVRFDAFQNEGDAMRTLLWNKNYSAFNVLLCIDDARQVAMQIVVAREMSKP